MRRLANKEEGPTLIAQEIELIARVGSGMPMGNMLRRYWIPALLTEELVEPDGEPKAIRLLGEDLVAFRDTEGRVGIMDLSCPHRLVSLALGRNEEGGLRCLYHGWKFDVNGKILETPCEAPGSRFKDHLRHLAYPTREAAGLIWVYMGPSDKTPAFPDFNWMSVPSTHRSIGKIWEECNFVQAMEGVLDSFHTNLLHSGYEVMHWTPEEIAKAWQRPSRATYGRIDFEPTPYGYHYAAVREPTRDPEHLDYVRITEYVAPFYCMNPPDLGGASRPFIFVPIDDYNTMMYEVIASEESVVQSTMIRPGLPKAGEPIDHESHLRRSTMRPGIDLEADYRPKRNRSNNYGQDRELMARRDKATAFSGIDAGVQTQDLAMIETMGAISDREREHLGASDLGIINFRKRLVDAVSSFVAGDDPPAIDPPLVYRDVRAVGALIAKGDDWRKVAWTSGQTVSNNT